MSNNYKDIRARYTEEIISIEINVKRIYILLHSIETFCKSFLKMGGNQNDIPYLGNVFSTGDVDYSNMDDKVKKVWMGLEAKDKEMKPFQNMYKYIVTTMFNSFPIDTLAYGVVLRKIEKNKLMRDAIEYTLRIFLKEKMPKKGMKSVLNTLWQFGTIRNNLFHNYHGNISDDDLKYLEKSFSFVKIISNQDGIRWIKTKFLQLFTYTYKSI